MADRGSGSHRNGFGNESATPSRNVTVKMGSAFERGLSLPFSGLLGY